MIYVQLNQNENLPCYVIKYASLPKKKREAVQDEFNYKSKIQGEYFDTKAAIKALSFDQSDFNALSLSYIIDYQDDFFFLFSLQIFFYCFSIKLRDRFNR